MASSVFQYRHRVVYAECTIGNHVYHSRYLDILEAARGEWLRSLGCTAHQLQEADTIFPVVGVEMTYKAPARYDDLLTIELWVAEAGGVRLNVAFRILNEAGELLVQGVTRHVSTTRGEKPKRLPAEFMEKIKGFVAAR